VGRFFTPPARWHGGHYELELRLGRRSDPRLTAALRALWSHPALEGPYADRDREPTAQDKVDPLHGLDDHLRGFATLPGGARTPCGSFPHRLGAEDVAGEDGLSFYLPVVGLTIAWPQVGRFPFPEPERPDDPGFPFPERWRRVDDRPWQEPLEEWFAEIGSVVFDAVDFRAGLVGFEIYVEAREWNRWVARGVPEKRGIGILRPGPGGLEWYPATMWGRWEPS